MSFFEVHVFYELYVSSLYCKINVHIYHKKHTLYNSIPRNVFMGLSSTCKKAQFGTAYVIVIMAVSQLTMKTIHFRNPCDVFYSVESKHILI